MSPGSISIVLCFSKCHLVARSKHTRTHTRVRVNVPLSVYVRVCARVVPCPIHICILVALSSRFFFFFFSLFACSCLFISVYKQTVYNISISAEMILSFSYGNKVCFFILFILSAALFILSASPFWCFLV